MRLTAVFEPAEEGGFIAYVEELPGANTQGETLEEARANLLDAVAPAAGDPMTGGRTLMWLALLLVLARVLDALTRRR